MKPRGGGGRSPARSLYATPPPSPPALNDGIWTLVTGTLNAIVHEQLPLWTAPIARVADVLKEEVVDGWAVAVADPVSPNSQNCHRLVGQDSNFG